MTEKQIKWLHLLRNHLEFHLIIFFIHFVSLSSGTLCFAGRRCVLVSFQNEPNENRSTKELCATSGSKPSKSFVFLGPISVLDLLLDTKAQLQNCSSLWRKPKCHMWPCSYRRFIWGLSKHMRTTRIWQTPSCFWGTMINWSVYKNLGDKCSLSYLMRYLNTALFLKSSRDRLYCLIFAQPKEHC